MYISGMTAVLLTYPLDVIRARLAFQVAGENIYTGIAHAFKMIFTNEGGVRGLYTGIVPTLMGMVPYAGKNNSKCYYLQQAHYDRNIQYEAFVSWQLHQVLYFCQLVHFIRWQVNDCHSS